MGILKFKKINFTAIRLISLKEVDIEKVLASNKISFGEKNHKYFIGYLYNDHKVNSVHITLLKTSAYVKSYHEDDEFLEKYTVFTRVSTWGAHLIFGFQRGC